MTAYILIIAILLILALAESGELGGRAYGKFACITLIVFGGLRLETGFDWVEYENYFELSRPVWSNQPQFVEPSLLVEPGFALFNVLVRSFGIPFQGFLFIITAINMYVIYIFSKRYTERVALVFLVYFGFVFLAAQMAAIRQSLSYSFLLLAFLQKEKGNVKNSIAMIVLSVSIHTFSLALSPLIYLRPKNIPIPFIIVLVGIGVITAFSGFHIVPLAADTLMPFLGVGFLATKLSLYGDYEGYQVSIVSLMFVPMHIGMYYLLCTERFRLAGPRTGITYFAISATLLSLITHSYFGVFPAFWNRVSYLTFLLQPVALLARYRAYLTDPTVRLVTAGLASTAGATIITYTLSEPTSLPYVPYQNVAVAWVTGDEGDGRERYAYAFQAAEREIASRRR